VGSVYARGIRQKRGTSFKDKWHVDVMRVVIKGQIFWLWRLIDSDRQEIEILLQKRRNAKSAIRFLKKALKRLGCRPRAMVTDKLRSYQKAHRILLKKTDHRSHKRLNNIIENSHQPTREKEKQMRKFKDSGSTQRYLTTMGTLLNLLKVGRYKNPAKIYRQKLREAFQVFDEIVLSSHNFA
jgi:putative transposase